MKTAKQFRQINQDTPQIDMMLFHKNRFGQRLNILEVLKMMQQLVILIYSHKNYYYVLYFVLSNFYIL